MPAIASALASRELAPMWCVLLAFVMLLVFGVVNLLWMRTNEKRFFPAVGSFLLAAVILVVVLLRLLA